MCWLRRGAGLGFLFDEERGLFRIEASRNLLSDEEDPWSEGLALLSSNLSFVFPAMTRDLQLLQVAQMLGIIRMFFWLFLVS